MTVTLTVRDETTLRYGQQNQEFIPAFATQHITVRELISGRVYQEVQAYNARLPEYFNGLIQPAEAEHTLNGYRMRQQRQIDWEVQFDKAIEAFQGNGFIILINDRQVDELDEFIEIQPDTSVTFLKLIPLVGG